MFRSLISNAVKFSPSGATVQLVVVLERKPSAVQRNRFTPTLLRLASGQLSPHRVAPSPHPTPAWSPGAASGGTTGMACGRGEALGEGGQQTECRVRISVKDEGPGISEEDQSRLFRPYVQVNAGALQKAGGTGLGLSISKLIVDLFGGEIGIESSQVGRGTTFFLSVPFVVFEGRPSITPSGASVSSTDAGLQKSKSRPLDGRAWDLNCLVVDDVFAIRKMVVRFLERYGIRATAVESGSRCIEFINGREEPQPDFILLDRSMPGLSGLQVARILRSEGCKIPIFGFTADALAEDQDEFISAGVNDVLTKPLRHEAFGSVMAKYFGSPASADRKPLERPGSVRLPPIHRKDDSAVPQLEGSGGEPAGGSGPAAATVTTSVAVDAASSHSMPYVVDVGEEKEPPSALPDCSLPRSVHDAPRRSEDAT